MVSTPYTLTPKTDWLTAKQAADYLRVSYSTMRRWTVEGIVPHHRLPSGRARYDPAELSTWVAASSDDVEVS